MIIGRTPASTVARDTAQLYGQYVWLWWAADPRPDWVSMSHT